MAGTTTIPLVTLQDGSRIFGPANVANPDVRTVLTVDRTPASGLGSLTTATTIELLVEQSNDGGTTWFELADGTIAGGAQADWRTGQPETASVIAVTFAPGTGRRVRATMTVAGGPVAVQGTLATS